MATVPQSAVLPALGSRHVSFVEVDRTNRKAGPALFLGGTAFAGAYILIGTMGLLTLAGLLAIAGTALVFLGLRSVATVST